MTLGPAYGGDSASIVNNVGTLYVKGDEFTDDSIRLVPQLANKLNVEMQLRTEGVWNSTGVQVRGTSLFLGDELIISSAGGLIRTFNLVEGLQSLVPHIDFDAGGTGFPAATILGPLQVRFVISNDDSSELIATQINVSDVPPVDFLATAQYFRTGSVVATAPVTFTFRRSSFSGPILWSKIVPTSLLDTPNTEFRIIFNGMLGAKQGDTVFGTFSSDEPFSLRTNPSQTVPWSAVDLHQISKEDLLTETLVLSSDLAITFANSLELARPNFVF